MRAERTFDDPGVQRKLGELRRRGYNFDPARPEDRTPANGWHVDDCCQALPAEQPGPPVEGGSWEIARRLMRGYEFADPSLVRAFYDSEEPLEGRTMLLELRFHGLLRLEAGTRVVEVYDEERIHQGRHARVWGWDYRTLRGHIEQGQMGWQVWKWLESGDVEFRIHAYSRRAPDPNLVIRLGCALFGRREQLAFYRSTMRRMARLTEAALRDEDGESIRRTAEQLTDRRGFGTAPAPEELSRWVGRSDDGPRAEER